MEVDGEGGSGTATAAAVASGPDQDVLVAPPPAPSPAIPVGPIVQDFSAAKNGTTCLPQRAALLKSMLNFLKKAISDPQFSDSIRYAKMTAGKI